MTRTRALVLFSVMSVTAAIGAQQTPVREGQASVRWIGSASLAGTVVNEVTSAPVRRAMVAIWSPDSAVRLSTVTDPDSIRIEINEQPAASLMRKAMEAWK